MIILKNLRMSFGLSQKQLAAFLEVSEDTISSIEKGLSFPTVPVLKKIALHFNVSTDYILGLNALLLNTADQIRLLEIYNSLSIFSQGRLFEKAISLAEESTQKNREEIRGGGECHLY